MYVLSGNIFFFFFFFLFFHIKFSIFAFEKISTVYIAWACLRKGKVVHMCKMPEKLAK